MSRAKFQRLNRPQVTNVNPTTGRYDAAVTPSTGTQALFDFYANVVSGAAAAPERGDHALF